jgi:hypothetical protein
MTVVMGKRLQQATAANERSRCATPNFHQTFSLFFGVRTQNNLSNNGLRFDENFHCRENAENIPVLLILFG